MHKGFFHLLKTNGFYIKILHNTTFKFKFKNTINMRFRCLETTNKN